MSDEEYVRSVWQNIGQYNYGGSTQYVYLADISTEFMDAPLFSAWSAAAEFTRERLEQIRQVEEEIRLLQSMVILLRSEPMDETAPIYKRTIARLEAVLAGLKQGLK